MITLNGESCELRAGESIARALEALGVQDEARGVAVAVDGEVVPRAQWRTFALADGARIEVLTAMQGG